MAPVQDNTVPEEDAVTTQCPVAHDFDPFADAYQADPAHALLDLGPVFYSPILDYFVVTRHEDVRAVMRDTNAFSSQNFAEPITALCPAAVATLERYEYRASRQLGTLDEPIHMARRRRLDEPFRAEPTAAWEPRIRQVMTAYLDRIVDAGSADLVRDIFWGAPAEVAIKFMGVPDEDVSTVNKFAAGVMTFIFGRPSEEDQVAACEVMGQHYAYAQDLIRRLLDDPDGPGLLPFAVRAYLAEPEVFDVDFLVSLAISTLAAAHETTSTSLANSMLLLLRHRESWDAICDDRALVAGAVEECLRVGHPLTTSRRLCVNDTTVAGVPIAAGSRMLLGLASANWDEAVFAQPGHFDIRRPNARRHLTFGFGSHFCLGAPLARLQMRVALEELSLRLPQMRLVDDQPLEYVPTLTSWSPRSLLVEW